MVKLLQDWELQASFTLKIEKIKKVNGLSYTFCIHVDCSSPTQYIFSWLSWQFSLPLVYYGALQYLPVTIL